MKYLSLSVIGLLVLTSCEEEEQLVSFLIEPRGFVLEKEALTEGAHVPEFSHRLAGGSVTFTGDNGIYEYDAEKRNLQQFEFALPAGEYVVECDVPDASLYGQPLASFNMEPVRIRITDSTRVVTVDVVPDCALVLVEDPREQLEHGVYILERHSSAGGYFASYPLTRDSTTGLYYAYFTPDTVPDDPSAFLWFYENTPGSASGGLPTAGFETGFTYIIRILE